MYSPRKIKQSPLRISYIKNTTAYTGIRRLTTGMRSEKCVVRRFRRCANVIECTYTNLDGTGYYTPRLYGLRLGLVEISFIKPTNFLIYVNIRETAACMLHCVQCAACCCDGVLKHTVKVSNK